MSVRSQERHQVVVEFALNQSPTLFVMLLLPASSFPPRCPALGLLMAQELGDDIATTTLLMVTPCFN